MKKSISILVAVFLSVSIWSVSNTLAFEVVTQEMMQQEMVTETDLIRTVDNFIILFDDSSSANEMVAGKDVTRIQATKALLKERNAWLPDLGYQAGLFSATSSGHKEIYPILPYNRDAFGAAIDKLPDQGGGPTMLQQELSSLRKPISGLSGKTAVIMFTDGGYSQVRGPKSALQIAIDIAKENDVCFYVVSSATEEQNKQILESVAKINACSRVVPLNAFLDNPHYLSGALFTVKTTTYARMTPMTQTRVDVNNVLFGFDSYTIGSEFNEKLDMLANFLKENPDAFVVASGFTDSMGDEEYNLGLSERRVNAVKDYLVNAGIDEDRIVAHWFGQLNPVGDNATNEGQALNRRVEFAVGGVN
jgi:OOP family OmpA-OmpF porin